MVLQAALKADGTAELSPAQLEAWLKANHELQNLVRDRNGALNVVERLLEHLVGQESTVREAFTQLSSNGSGLTSSQLTALLNSIPSTASEQLYILTVIYQHTAGVTVTYDGCLDAARAYLASPKQENPGVPDILCRCRMWDGLAAQSVTELLWSYEAYWLSTSSSSVQRLLNFARWMVARPRHADMLSCFIVASQLALHTLLLNLVP